jgi:hypothetical protein
MALTHLSLAGDWEACANGSDCSSPVHVDVSVEDAQLLPTLFVYMLAEMVDPPNHVEEDGTKNWRSETGGLHRDYGLPAVIWDDGTCWWYQRGNVHRDQDRPAVVHPDGYRLWYREGHEQRENGAPTRVYADGGQGWYSYWGLSFGIHRDGAPALIEADGTQIWYHHAKIHREDGPAIVRPDGSREYWFHGKLTKSYHA